MIAVDLLFPLTLPPELICSGIDVIMMDSARTEEEMPPP